MSAAYRCCACGQFRDGYGVSVEWFDNGIHGAAQSGEIDLCPVCAPAIIDQLTAIAATAHEAPEMILARGEVRTGDEHTDADDAQWLSESDS